MKKIEEENKGKERKGRDNKRAKHSIQVFRLKNLQIKDWQPTPR